MLTHKVSLANGIHAVQADGSKVQLCKEGDGQRGSGLACLELECIRLPKHAGDCEPLRSPRNTNVLSWVFVIRPGSQRTVGMVLFMVPPYRHCLLHCSKKPSGLSGN